MNTSIKVKFALLGAFALHLFSIPQFANADDSADSSDAKLVTTGGGSSGVKSVESVSKTK